MLTLVGTRTKVVWYASAFCGSGSPTDTRFNTMTLCGIDRSVARALGAFWAAHRVGPRYAIRGLRCVRGGCLCSCHLAPRLHLPFRLRGTAAAQMFCLIRIVTLTHRLPMSAASELCQVTSTPRSHRAKRPNFYGFRRSTTINNRSGLPPKNTILDRVRRTPPEPMVSQITPGT